MKYILWKIRKDNYKININKVLTQYYNKKYSGRWRLSLTAYEGFL